MKALRVHLAALCAAGVFFSATPAFPQDPSLLPALIDRLERLERDLGLITRQLANEGVPESAHSVGEGDAEAVARQEARFSELEDQLRQLTGQIEKAYFALRQVGDRVELMVDDTDARLAAIERRLAETPASTPGPIADAGGGPLSTMAIDSGSFSNEGHGVLGTIPAGGTDVAAAQPPEDQSVAGAYSQAFQLLSQTDYAAAQAGFQAIIDDYPEDPLAGNAHFWIGEIYMKQGDQQSAAVAFARAYKGFPDGNKAADSLLKLGLAFAAMDKMREACAAYERLTRELGSAPVHITDRLPVARAEASC